jgi:hypothetical protein
LPVNDRLDPLQIGHETAFGDGGNVHADATLFLGFATAPDFAALYRAFSSQFTITRHNSKPFLKRQDKLPAIQHLASLKIVFFLFRQAEKLYGLYEGLRHQR